MSLKAAVELYRSSEVKKFSEGRVELEIPFDMGRSLVEDFLSNWKGAVDLVVDDQLVDTDASLPEVGRRIKLEFSVPSGSEITFYENVTALLSRGKAVSRGEIPCEYYVKSIDYYTGDETKHSEIVELENSAKIIRSLSDLARYHDEKVSGAPRKLIFIPSVNSYTKKPVTLETKLTCDILPLATNAAAEFLDSIAAGSTAEDIHASERRNIFESSITEFLWQVPDAIKFKHLLEHWNEFRGHFENNFNVYISGFAFLEIKESIARKELQFANEYSKVTSDIVAKLFGIPVSLAAILAMTEAVTLLKQELLLFGVLTAGLIISGAVINQQIQFRRIKHSKELVLSDLNSRMSTYPLEVQDHLKAMGKNLRRNDRWLRIVLWTFRFLTWVPPIIGAAYFCYVHDIDGFYRSILSAKLSALCSLVS